MKSEILRLLKETDGYISGQELCERFHVSRTAIWKVMEQLKKEGYQIESVRNKGYRLVESPDVLSQAEIESQFAADEAGIQVVYFDRTDSTNNQAKAAGEAGAADRTLFVADTQEAGKGRRGRTWVSPAGESIYMTLLLRPDIDPADASMLTLVMGLSVTETIRAVAGLPAKIKWPNDIVLEDQKTGKIRKVCGILTELSAEIESINYVVIGIGINVNQTEFPEELKDTATSLKLELGHSMRRAELIAAVLAGFDIKYDIFLKTKDLSGIADAYNALLINRDRDVQILEPGKEYEAHALGINTRGELVVRMPDGKKRQIYAGEVSVRGGNGNGYV